MGQWPGCDARPREVDGLRKRANEGVCREETVNWVVSGNNNWGGGPAGALTRRMGERNHSLWTSRTVCRRKRTRSLSVEEEL